MKRKMITLLLLLLAVLTGCGAAPETTYDGTPWDEDWTTVGNRLGAETPEGGFVLSEQSDALALSGLYYVTWVYGEAETYVNADEEETDLYPAQLYLLMKDCKSEETAAEAISEWQAQEEESYTVSETWSEDCGGVTFTFLVYTTDSEDNPYARGISAFGYWEDLAICAELACREEYTGDEQTILIDFLTNLHYAADE